MYEVLLVYMCMHHMHAWSPWRPEIEPKSYLVISHLLLQYRLQRMYTPINPDTHTTVTLTTHKKF